MRKEERERERGGREREPVSFNYFIFITRVLSEMSENFWLYSM